MKEENAKLRGIIKTLWTLLDNIDTLDDSCKNDDLYFRNQTRKQQQKRWDTGIICDGLNIDIDTALKR